jgi:tRNA A-37 threonylcarbamoyl transferase component Bud32
MRSRVLYTQSPQWLDAINHPDKLVAGAGFHEVKNISRNRAGFIESAHGTIFVKRLAPGSWIEGMLQRLRGSAARRSLRATQLLTAAGFLVPAPLAASEEIALGAIRASWIFSRALTSGKVFSRFIERGHAAAEVEKLRRREALAAVARCVRRLHDAGLFTSDLQETNLMLDRSGDGVNIHFVDLDGFRQLIRVSWKRRRRNLVQLDRSVGRFMSRSERMRFLHTYLGPGWDREAVRKLVVRLLAERERKERQFARRRLRRDAAPIWNAPVTPDRKAAAPEVSQPG